MKTLCLLILLLLAPGVVFAKTVREAKVLGWLGDEVYVRVDERGTQDDEEGTPKAYRSKSIDVYSRSFLLKDSKTPSKFGKSKRQKSYLLSSSGPLSAHLKNAIRERPDRKALTKVHKDALSKSRSYAVNISTSKTIERKAKQARCALENHIRLFDKTTKQIFHASSFTNNGEFQADRFPECPKENYQVFWSQDDRSFVVLSLKGESSVYNFSVEAVRNKVKAKQARRQKNPISLEPWLAQDPLWMAIAKGDKYEIKEASKRKDSLGKLGHSLLQIQNDQRSRGTKNAKKVVKKMTKSIRNYTFAAVVFRAADKTQSVMKMMDTIVKKATVPQLLRSANIFLLFDLDIAAQLYVVALSSKKMKEENAISVYNDLLRCLLDSGNMSAAKEVVEKVKSLKGDLGIQEMRYRILRREPDVLTDIQSYVEQNPTDCEGYLVLGRAFGYKRSKEAMNQYLTAMQCDPNLGEAAYLLAEMKKRAGNRAEANVLFDHYRKVSKSRKGDVVRDARRQYAYEMTHPKKKDDAEADESKGAVKKTPAPKKKK